jgi:hypothetical protein
MFAAANEPGSMTAVRRLLPLRAATCSSISDSASARR